MSKQNSFTKTSWRHDLQHGGVCRQKKAGRGARPLSSKNLIHLVLKTNTKAIPTGLRLPKTYILIHEVVRQYAKRFLVKIDCIAVERDHIHIAIRCPKRSLFQSFFRVVPGQIAQRVTDTFTHGYEGPRIWKYRPFTRVVQGRRDEQTVRRYVRLNELEARGEIPYQKDRLRGLTKEQLAKLDASTA